MKTLFWKLAFVFYMVKQIRCPPLFAWDCAESWLECFGIDECSPEDAVFEELSNWTE